MATNIQIKEVIKSEYIKCATDPIHFMKKYCYISHPKKGRILFNLYPFQENVLHDFKINRHVIINKSRQLGISTLAAGYALHTMLFQKNKTVLCIATKQETAKGMVDKVQFMFQNLPSWLKGNKKPLSNNKLSLQLANGSQIIATSASSDTGRSYAVSLLIIDEAAFIENIDKIYTSIKPTIACIEYNSIVNTNKGLYRIGELHNTNEMFFNDININIINRYNQLENSTHSYKSPKSKTLKIKFNNGSHIIGTHKHPLLKINNNGEEWVELKNLKIGDKIKHIYNTNNFGNKIKYPNYTDLHFNTKPYKIKDNIDFAYLIGLWIAEGSYSELGINIANQNVEIINFLKQNDFKYTGKNNYVLNSVIVKRIFKEYLNIQEEVSNKKVPSLILCSSREEQIAFLQGCFDSNGSSHKKGISYVSISEQLIQDIQIMLYNFGIKSKIIKQSWKKTNRYKLTINIHESKLFYNLIGFRLNKKQNNSIEYKELKNLYNIHKNSVTISDIEEYDEIETYDLKVPNSNSFLVNGIISHNTGGSIIALSSPNGIGNWFHRMYNNLPKSNDFHKIELKWNLHPDRDEKWYQEEKNNMSTREFAQEYDCDFLGSGNTVVESGLLAFYEENYIREPKERRFMGNDFWIWEYVDFAKNYIVTADVSRGDGGDYSAFHVIDVDACEQVAEYKSQIGTREYGHMLVSVATEYNNALLVVENSNIGWDVVQTILERGYTNMYFSPRSYGEITMDKYIDKMESEQIIPGFTNSTKTRPLVISKMESYIREKSFIFHSKRLLEELKVFIWHNGKAQAQSGYNDDLVISLGIGLFIRDTALKFNIQHQKLTRAAISGITQDVYTDLYPTFNNVRLQNIANPYVMNVNGKAEDITWILG